MDSLKMRKLLPPGPILTMILIGLLLLGSLLYYRAIRIQRFLEPTLALFQPKIMFSNALQNALSSEFGRELPNGIKLEGDSIHIRVELIFAQLQKEGRSDILKRLGRVFLTILDNPETRSNVDIILVGARSPISGDPNHDRAARHFVQEAAETALNNIFLSVPELERRYAMRFSSGAFPANIPTSGPEWIEFHIFPSENLHIDVLQKLEKYAK